MKVAEILNRLVAGRGVAGALLVTEDGVLVAASGLKRAEAERIGALTTDFLRHCQRQLRWAGLYGTRRLVLEAELGRLVVHDVDGALLVALPAGRLQPENTLVEIAGAAERLRRLGRLTAPMGT